jgi:hypothetical protein
MTNASLGHRLLAGALLGSVHGLSIKSRLSEAVAQAKGGERHRRVRSESLLFGTFFPLFKRECRLAEVLLTFMKLI